MLALDESGVEEVRIGGEKPKLGACVVQWNTEGLNRALEGEKETN